MLSQFLKKKQSPDKQPSVGDYAKDFFVHGYAHCCALLELFIIELGEYSQVAKRRAIFACIAASAFALFYLSIWAMLAMYMWQNWCAYGALAVFAGFHFLIAAIFTVFAKQANPGPLAPMTKEELNTDLTCIRLSLKENTKP